MKTYKIGTNQAGCRYAIVERPEGFAVYRECANYAAHVRGAIAYTWRYVQKGITLEEARALFDRAIAGRVKA